MNSAPPTPHRSILAVWHWPRWVWGVVVGVCIVYWLTAIPVLYALSRAGVPIFEVIHIYNTVYSPVVFTEHHVPGASAILSWQIELMEWLFGPWVD